MHPLGKCVIPRLANLLTQLSGRHARQSRLARRIRGPQLSLVDAAEFVTNSVVSFARCLLLPHAFEGASSALPRGSRGCDQYAPSPLSLHHVLAASACAPLIAEKKAGRVARDRCSHTNFTIHAEFRSGSRDIDNPPFFASRSEKNIGRSPVLKRAGFLHKALPQSDLPVGIDSGKRLSKFTTLEV